MRAANLIAAFCVFACSPEPRAPAQSADDVIQERLQREFGAPEATAPWRYTATVDEMRGRVRIVGCTSAVTNDGSISAEPMIQLCIQTDEGGDINVVTLIAAEMIDCRALRCTVALRADDGAVEDWRVEYAPTGATRYNIIGFVRSAALLEALKASSELRVEVPLYESGFSQVRFDTRNLHWPPPPNERNLAEEAAN